MYILFLLILINNNGDVCELIYQSKFLKPERRSIKCSEFFCQTEQQSKLMLSKSKELGFVLGLSRSPGDISELTDLKEKFKFLKAYLSFKSD